MKITFYGHSCFGVEYNGVRLLFDPFITPNEQASGVDISAIRPEYILVSHGHSDHVADVETISRATNSVIISSYEIASYYGAKGLPHHPMNIGGSWDFGRFRVKCVNAVHSSVLPDGTYAGNPMGFIVSGGSQTFYYSGDTALHMDMQLLGQKHRIDLAFLCIGDNFTMGIDDAVSAAGLVRCDTVVGMHFDTFPFIRISHDRAKKAFAEAGKQLILPVVGQTFEL
jgi:L-ascorbate metabolism protein UlaG (beta-lactamase superfamily)